MDEHFEHYLKSIPMLAELVEDYGARAVWDAGFEVKGHPITWAPSAKDCLLVRRYLKEKENG